MTPKKPEKKKFTHCKYCSDLIERRKNVGIKVKQTGEMLSHAKLGDAGYDLRSTEDGIILAGERESFNTGMTIAIPEGYHGRITSRSGLAFKHGIFAVEGTIDAGYRGEVRVLLHNSSSENMRVKKGDRIAQIVFLKHEDPEFILVDILEDNTERGAGGFGHTGV